MHVFALDCCSTDFVCQIVNLQNCVHKDKGCVLSKICHEFEYKV